MSHDTRHADRQSQWLMAIITTGLAIRLAVLSGGPLADPDRAMLDDSPRYVTLGDNIANRATFGLPAETDGTIYAPIAQLRTERGEIEPLSPTGLRPETMRTPGYPFLIALTRWLGWPLTTVLIIQCIMSTATIAMTYAIAARLLRRRKPALIAAALIAFNPAEIVTANSVLSETLFTFLMMAGLAIAVLYRDRGAWHAATGGVLLGLSTLVRPIGIMLGPAVALWMVATHLRTRTAALASVLALASLTPAALWAQRNVDVGAGYRLSYMAPLQAFSKTATFMEMKDRQLTRYPQDWRPILDAQFDELRATIEPDETVYGAMSRIAWGRITSRPWLYLRTIGNNAVKFMTDHSALDLYRTFGHTYQPTGLRDRLLRGQWSLRPGDDLVGLAIATAWIGFNTVLAILTLVGLVRLAIDRRFKALLLLGGLMFYFLVATQAHGLERMRLPVLGVQAVAAIAAVTGRPSRRRFATTPAAPQSPHGRPAPLGRIDRDTAPRRAA